MVSSKSCDQPGRAPCVGAGTCYLVTGYLIRPAETWPTVHSTLCPLPPRSPSVYRNLRMLGLRPGPALTSDECHWRSLLLSLISADRLLMCVQLLTLSRRDWGQCHNITMSRTVPGSQDQCSNCSLRARSNFTCSLYTVRLLGANCELSPVPDFHIHKNSRNAFWLGLFFFFKVLSTNKHFFHECSAKKYIFQM